MPLCSLPHLRPCSQWLSWAWWPGWILCLSVHFLSVCLLLSFYGLHVWNKRIHSFIHYDSWCACRCGRPHGEERRESARCGQGGGGWKSPNLCRRLLGLCEKCIDAVEQKSILNTPGAIDNIQLSLFQEMYNRDRRPSYSAFCLRYITEIQRAPTTYQYRPTVNLLTPSNYWYFAATQVTNSSDPVGQFMRCLNMFLRVPLDILLL